MGLGGGCWLTFTRTFEVVNASPAPAGIDGVRVHRHGCLSSSLSGLEVLQANGGGNHVMGAFPRGGRLMGTDIFGALAWIRPSDSEALGGAD